MGHDVSPVAMFLSLLVPPQINIQCLQTYDFLLEMKVWLEEIRHLKKYLLTNEEGQQF